MISASVVPGFQQQLERAALAETGKRLSGVLDGVARRVLLDGFRAAGADEGTVWIANPGARELVPVMNSGPDEESFLRQFRQPLDRGVISMVFLSGHAFCENEVSRNATHDRTIDAALSQVTVAMIAVPLFFANRPRGVASCVRLGSGAFEMAHLREMQHCVAVFERMIDGGLLQNLLESDFS
ncbi:MAG: hypothetical protein DVB23_002375 [Verrucomicrobia bacterium]|jgi:hypothetical protein|nr:MAG: hypothetical protein DVB23_002375 [Verrucomicrobiota bacterium]